MSAAADDGSSDDEFPPVLVPIKEGVVASPSITTDSGRKIPVTIITGYLGECVKKERRKKIPSRY